jgi:hypothetical protein
MHLASVRRRVETLAPGMLAIALAIGKYSYPFVADVMLTFVVLGYVWVALTADRTKVWYYAHGFRRPNLIRAMALTGVAVVVGPTIYHVRHPPPEYPDVLAAQTTATDVDRQLTYFNPPHTVENIRVSVIEHAQDRGLPHGWGPVNIGTLGPNGNVALGVIHLRPPRDVYWIEADTTEGKFWFSYIFDQRPDGSWHQEYAARLLGHEKAFKEFKDPK